MHHRILRAASVWNEVHEILQSLSDVHLARTVIKDAVGGKQLALVLVDLLPVVRQLLVCKFHNLRSNLY